MGKVKEDSVFKEAKGAKNFGISFKKEDLKEVAEKVSGNKVNAVFEMIKDSLLQNKMKEDTTRE